MITGRLPLLRPMLSISSAPFDSAGHLYEVKWDGYRCLAYLENGTVLMSRNGVDITGKFPELAGLCNRVKRLPAVLDGEIVVFEEGRPSFARLQSRGRMNGPECTGRASLKRPAVYVVFDVLYSDGENVMGLPLTDRKELLEDTTIPGGELAISQYIIQQGRDFFEACVGKGLEGVVAKKLDSVYLPGRRSTYWQKFRNTKEADLVICGYQYGLGGRKLGSLVLGGYRGGELVYQGKVGTGFNEQEADILLEGLQKLEIRAETLAVPREEKRGTRWVQPALVCSVNYLTITAGGCLRHPVYRGVRWDKSPQECQAVSQFTARTTIE